MTSAQLKDLSSLQGIGRGRHFSATQFGWRLANDERSAAAADFNLMHAGRGRKIRDAIFTIVDDPNHITFGHAFTLECVTANARGAAAAEFRSLTVKELYRLRTRIVQCKRGATVASARTFRAV